MRARVSMFEFRKKNKAQAYPQSFYHYQSLIMAQHCQFHNDRITHPNWQQRPTIQTYVHTIRVPPQATPIQHSNKQLSPHLHVKSHPQEERRGFPRYRPTVINWIAVSRLPVRVFSVTTRPTTLGLELEVSSDDRPYWRVGVKWSSAAQ